MSYLNVGTIKDHANSQNESVKLLAASSASPQRCPGRSLPAMPSMMDFFAETQARKILPTEPEKFCLPLQKKSAYREEKILSTLKRKNCLPWKKNFA